MKELLTVSELNGLIKEVVNYGFPNALWVCGEIQNFDRNRHKNHIFFELCEKDPASKDIVARVGLVIFAGRKAYIDDILKNAENGFSLKDDIEVKFLCRVDFYPPHGAIRLMVESIDPIYTLGKIAQERQKLIALLQKQGVLDKNKTLPLPVVPLHVGLITSYDSAAYNDFISELKRSGIGFNVSLINSLMQGKGAEASVCRALEQFSAMDGFDVIVITRGGGSIAELSCFDSRLIAERIAANRYPVLSGIGHEINTTITDLAAHTYAKTPTAIAQFLVTLVLDYLGMLDDKMDAVLELAQKKISDQSKQLRLLAIALQRQMTVFLSEHEEILNRLATQAADFPRQRLTAELKVISQYRAALIGSANTSLVNARLQAKNYSKMIDLISPKNILRKGFTITRNSQGAVIRRLKDVKENEHTVTEVLDGFIHSEVLEKKEETRG